MSKFTEFKDEDGNTLTSYINSNEKVFIKISDKYHNEYSINYITLDIFDLSDLIKHLQGLKKDLQNNL